MSYAEAVRLALGSFRSNKMRSLLTLLGVIIGISSVIAILTLGASLKAQMVEGLAAAGVNDYTVRVEARPDEGEEKTAQADAFMYVPPEPVAATSKITPELIDTFSERFRGRISGVSVGSTSYNSGEAAPSDDPTTTHDVTLSAVNPDYMAMQSSEIGYGRTLAEDDVTGERSVAVVTRPVVDALFAGDAAGALGQTIDYTASDGATFPLMIVGVLAEDESGGLLAGSFKEYRAYAPWTIESRLDTDDPGLWEQVSVRPAPGENGEALLADLNSFLELAYADDPEFTASARDMSRDFDVLKTIIDSLSIGLSVIAGISLLVGGIGVMNIMLVTVTERTREIGVRKALGARNADIRRQFVIESMIICLVGGVIGVLLGGALGMVGAHFLGKVVLPPVIGVVVALGFSMGIGVFFGFYPAEKAARLRPIDALRYE
ncbi:ABC transporter permease [Corynebacterium pygosceleis]|uniref:ABC transporter permease n=1 Tax=Corynebacterium pygosceleis TaxID=2800406 RepID=UPI002002AC43|nr:ABC transporter permease [Corynebacterium pygosceleis]